MSYYKRYGFKQPSGNSGGAYDKYTIFRFFVVLTSFLSIIASIVFSEEHYAELYFFSGLLYLVFGFLPEFFDKLKNLPVVILATAILWLCTHKRIDIFSYSVSHWDPTLRYYVREVIFIPEAFYTFVSYNLIVVLFSFVFIWPFGTQLTKRSI